MPCFGPRGGGRGSLQEDQAKYQAPHFGPRGGGEEEAKPSRLRLAEPAHARVAGVRARHTVVFVLVLLEHAAASDAAHDRNDPSPGSSSAFAPPPRRHGRQKHQCLRTPNSDGQTWLK